ncbi:RNA ligase family protein [Limnoglobus roseus]|uniref:Uncharacterized protein n=1 Tax=Limnoglobus roseus TaxID=2598579 RepID=A0A5C1AG94_9BACT|nr:RNA ligase family protein [Limnoglobus roseus]QEL17167.1 hypothetical protein PX52LOC_04149 [Limnoglobus roseus]
MFRYPKMPGPAGGKLEKCLAFEKYDGTNLHWEWHRDHGWHDFGTRSASYPMTPAGFADFRAKHTALGEATGIFQEQFAERLTPILQSQGEAFVAFTEFLGANSFAGLHKADDPKRLVLIDVFAVGTGFYDPWAFRELFGSLPVARVVYEGRFMGKFTEDVRAGKYAVAEGVVCKGGKGADVWMAKIKTNAFMQRLKAAFASDWEQYWE